jgi:SAM-dependent methyltransferase
MAAETSSSSFSSSRARIEHGLKFSADFTCVSHVIPRKLRTTGDPHPELKPSVDSCRLVMTDTNQTEYERLQSFNFLTAWLHSVRYRNILRTIKDYDAARASSGPIRILEIGCGPGKLYGLLDVCFPIDYCACEIDPAFVATARRRYGHRPNFKLTDQSITSGEVSLDSYDVIVALETLEHIPEHEVVRLVELIAYARPKLFICSVPIEIGPALWLKNAGACLCRYPRYKEYTWAQTFWAGCYQLDKVPLHRTSHIGFDWRWLAQTIRHNMTIKEFRRFPIHWLPAAVSSSVFMVAEPRD